MSFISSVILPTGTKSTATPSGGTTSSSFIKSVVVPSVEEQKAITKQQTISQDTQLAQENAAYANSFLGMAKNTISNIGNTFGSIFEHAKDALFAAPAPKANLLQNPYAPLDAGASALTTAIQQGGERLANDMGTIFNTHSTALEKGVAVGDAAVSTIGAVFGALLSPIQAVAAVPVIGYAADAVNNLFGAIGSVGADAAQQPVDALPVSDDTKDLIRPLAREIGALAAQFIAGKAGGDIMGKLVDKSKTVLDLVDKDVTKQVKIISETPAEQPIKIGTPITKHSDYANSMGYEPYTPIEALPIIKFGDKNGSITSALKTIQANAPAPRKVAGDFTIEPIKPAPIIGATPEIGKIIPKKPTPPIIPKVLVPLAREARGFTTAEDFSANLPEASIKKIEASYTTVTNFYDKATKGGTKLTATAPKVGTEVVEQAPNTRAATLEKAAIEKKLTTSFGELPTHDKIDMAQQTTKALDYIEKDVNRALKVAKGEELPPSDILPQSIYTALEIRAMKNGDVEMLRDLSKSTLPTTAGQQMKALDSADPNSPVKIMRDIRAAREDTVTKQTGKKSTYAKKAEAKKIDETIKKSVSKRATWDEFIKEIQCN